MKLAEFLNLFKQGKITAHSHMKNLLEMAYADGKFDATEDSLLKEIAKRHGVSMKKLDEIRDSPDQIEFVLPDNPDEKFGQFYDLVRMMVVDEDVDDKELSLCVLFARKFGYDPKHAEELVDSVARNIQAGNDSLETRMRIEWMLG